MPVMGHFDEFVRELRLALGLPKNAVWFEVRCAVDEIVTIKCAYHPERPEAFDPRKFLQTYKLVPIGEAVSIDPEAAEGDEIDVTSMEDTTERRFAIARKDPGEVVITQHINIHGPRNTYAEVAAAMQAAKEGAARDVAEHFREVRERPGESVGAAGYDDGLPAAPSIKGTIIGWGLFGVVCVLGVVTYTLGWWP